MSAPLLLTIDQAADLLSCSSRSIWSLTKAGAIPCVRLGGLVRFSAVDLEAWLAAGRADRLAALKPLPARKVKRDGRRRVKGGGS